MNTKLVHTLSLKSILNPEKFQPVVLKHTQFNPETQEFNHNTERPQLRLCIFSATDQEFLVDEERGKILGKSVQIVGLELRYDITFDYFTVRATVLKKIPDFLNNEGDPKRTTDITSLRDPSAINNIKNELVERMRTSNFHVTENNIVDGSTKENFYEMDEEQKKKAIAAVLEFKKGIRKIEPDHGFKITEEENPMDEVG